MDGGFPLADSLDVLLVLSHLRLFVLVALPGHLTEVGVARVLGLRASHLGLHAANLGLLTRVIAPDPRLLDSLLDLARGQLLPLLEDLIGALLELQAQWAQALGGWLLGVWVDVLLGHIVLHPVDVKRAWLCSINR